MTIDSPLMFSYNENNPLPVHSIFMFPFVNHCNALRHKLARTCVCLTHSLSKVWQHWSLRPNTHTSNLTATAFPCYFFYLCHQYRHQYQCNQRTAATTVHLNSLSPTPQKAFFLKVSLDKNFRHNKKKLFCRIHYAEETIWQFLHTAL